MKSREEIEIHIEALGNALRFLQIGANPDKVSASEKQIIVQIETLKWVLAASTH